MCPLQLRPLGVCSVVQVSGRAARVLSYFLANNQQCKQAVLAQEAQKASQFVDGTMSQAGLLPFVVNRVCAMCSDATGIIDGRYSSELGFRQTTPGGRCSLCGLLDWEAWEACLVRLLTLVVANTKSS